MELNSNQLQMLTLAVFYNALRDNNFSNTILLFVYLIKRWLEYSDPNYDYFKNKHFLLLLVSFEFDALSEWQILAVIDCASAAAHVLLPGIRSRLPAASRVFLTAKGAANLGSARPDVDVDDPAVRSFRSQPLFQFAFKFEYSIE